jgi:hypothetical protein
LEVAVSGAEGLTAMLATPAGIEASPDELSSTWPCTWSAIPSCDWARTPAPFTLCA